jgi:hypothetical protein
VKYPIRLDIRVKVFYIKGKFKTDFSYLMRMKVAGGGRVKMPGWARLPLLQSLEDGLFTREMQHLE